MSAVRGKVVGDGGLAPGAGICRNHRPVARRPLSRAALVGRLVKDLPQEAPSRTGFEVQLAPASAQPVGTIFAIAQIEGSGASDVSALAAFVLVKPSVEIAGGAGVEPAILAALENVPDPHLRNRGGRWWTRTTDLGLIRTAL